MLGFHITQFWACCVMSNFLFYHVFFYHVYNVLSLALSLSRCLVQSSAWCGLSYLFTFFKKKNKKLFIVLLSHFISWETLCSPGLKVEFAIWSNACQTKPDLQVKILVCKRLGEVVGKRNVLLLFPEFLLISVHNSVLTKCCYWSKLPFSKTCSWLSLKDDFKIGWCHCHSIW